MSARLRRPLAALVLTAVGGGALGWLLLPSAAPEPLPDASVRDRDPVAKVVAPASTPAVERDASGPPSAPIEANRVLCAASGSPIPGARVAVRRPGSTLLAALTCGPKGTFELPPLPMDELELVAAAPGWLCSPVQRVSDGSRGLTVRLDPGASLRGRVVCADGGPLPKDVAVRVVDVQPGYVAPEAPPTVDAEGEFSLSGLPSGALSLAAEGSGWTGAVATGTVEAFGRAALVLVLHRLHPTPTPARAPPEASEATCLRLRVFGPQRRRLADATVTLTDSCGRDYTSQSGPSGELEFEGFASGALVVTATSPGLAADRLRLETARRSHPLDLHLEALIPVASGRFVDSRGEPLRGALAFDPQPPDRHHHASERLPFEAPFDAQGRPAIEGLPDGVWVVSVPELVEDELRAWVRTIDTAQETDLALALPSSARGRLEGRVFASAEHASADPVRVELRPTSLTGRFRFVAARHADASGSFTFDAVPEGTYRVQAFWEGGMSQVAHAEVRAGSSEWATLSPAARAGGSR